MPDISQVITGNTIVFESLAPNDPTIYRGQVVGFVTLDIAKGYGDVYTYNSTVQTADPSVPAPDLLNFMLIKLLEAPSTNFGSGKYIMPFATEWVSPPSLEIIAVNKAVNIKVYEIDQSNIQSLVDYLRAGSFKIKVVSYE
jgi:hypothetical protein